MPYATALSMTQGEPLIFAGPTALKFYGRTAYGRDCNGPALDAREGDAARSTRKSRPAAMERSPAEPFLRHARVEAPAGDVPTGSRLDGSVRSTRRACETGDHLAIVT